MKAILNASALAAMAAALPGLVAAQGPDPAQCAGFSAADAAPLIGAPAAQVTRHVEKLTPKLATCSYAAGKGAPALAFSVEVHASDKAASAALERYREDLSLAGESGPWRGKLPKGAYSDISGIGDDAVWTDINGALTVRVGRMNLQFTRPAAKLDQVKAAQAVTRRR